MIKKQYRVNSLVKGLKVLEIFAIERRPIRLSELISIMGISHTSATRMCSTLCMEGYLKKDEDKFYRIAPKVLTLGYAAISGLRWLELAELSLKKLFDNVQETINLAILQDSEILYLLRLRKEKYLPFDLQVGSTLPVHCTAMGKVLMALSPPEITDDIWPMLNFKIMGPRAIRSRNEFQKILVEVRRRGYAINDEELAIGVRTVAVPILDREGYALMSINISVPTKRFYVEEIVDQMLPPLQETAEELSRIFMDINLTRNNMI